MDGIGSGLRSSQRKPAGEGRDTLMMAGSGEVESAKAVIVVLLMDDTTAEVVEDCKSLSPTGTVADEVVVVAAVAGDCGSSSRVLRVTPRKVEPNIQRVTDRALDRQAVAGGAALEGKMVEEAKRASVDGRGRS